MVALQGEDLRRLRQPQSATTHAGFRQDNAVMPGVSTRGNRFLLPTVAAAGVNDAILCNTEASAHALPLVDAQTSTRCDEPLDVVFRHYFRLAWMTVQHTTITRVLNEVR